MPLYGTAVLVERRMQYAEIIVTNKIRNVGSLPTAAVLLDERMTCYLLLSLTILTLFVIAIISFQGIDGYQNGRIV